MKKIMIFSFILASLSGLGYQMINENYELNGMNRISNIEYISKKTKGTESTKKTRKSTAKKDEKLSGDREMTADVSKSEKPQNDFYKYINENWEKRTKIPDTKPAWGSFTELSEKNQDFLRNLIKELKGKKELTNDEKKILTLYNSYFDIAGRNRTGLAPLKKELEQISSIKNIDDFEKFSVESTKKGGGILYGWGIGADLNDSKNYAVYLGAAGGGLSRDYYQKDTPENREIIKKYTDFVSDILKYIGENDTDEKAKSIVEFEKKIAQTLLTNEEMHDIKKRNNVRTVSELSKITKNVDLADYLKKSGVNTEKVIIGEIKYYENLDSLINNENLEVIKNYMKFHLASNSASLLTDELGQKSYNFYGKYLNGQKQREVLEKRALYFVNANLGEIIGKVYVERSFSPEAKKDTQEMVDYIVKAFRNRMSGLTWMSKETKEKALEKLGKFTVKIGYPDKWRNFDELNFDKSLSLYEQTEKINEWAYKEELKEVGKPVDKAKWFMNAHEVNAYYSPTGNEIVFPAGILQFPFYDLVKSGPGSNFGGIGAVIGHEITHGFDVSGANFDGDGNVKDWWTAEDRKKFDSITKKLEEEFSGYSVSENVKVNGKFTLTENIADLGGVNIAYDALKMYLADHPEKNVKVNGVSQEELFFMNYARIWRQKATEEYLNNLAKSDSHSPNYFRVNGTLINVDAFHELFKTRKGDRLYKESSERIKIW